MFKDAKILRLITLMLVVIIGCSPEKVPEVSLTTVGGGGDLCSNKERCVIAFMAPWCPVCKSSIPFLKRLREKLNTSDEVGFKIIVGDDDEETLQTMASAIGGVTYLDTQNEFHRAMRFTAVPSWWVTDGNGKVLERFSGGEPRGGGPDEGIKWFIAQKLKLDSYF